MSFCQFGGHSSSITLSAKDNLATVLHDTLIWKICYECSKKFMEEILVWILS
jgi:hypothetical protein